MANKVHGSHIRDRARKVRDVGALLASRFRASQVGTLRSGLTLTDSLVLTDNYLKVRVPGVQSDNVRVQVRITQAGDTLSGAIISQ